MQTESIKALTLSELLNSEEQYVIPIYQRNYAWEAKEIEQLIQDVIDYSIHHSNKNYYIGTLVVAIEQNGFNTIDGQQRLTTLSILTAVIKNLHKEINVDWFNSLNLHYESREKSVLSMNAAFKGVFGNENYEPNIKAAYEICSRELVKKTVERGISITEFANYLYKYVKILRVPLPKGIDLNHYFEIMNSRGEQLEKHEILKAKLMECFNSISIEQKAREKYFNCFNLIWEACSNIEKYVQYGFTTEQRHLIFGQNNWNTISVYDFDDFVNKLNPTLLNDTNSVKQSIDEIIKANAVPYKEEENDDNPERFNSIVNFQNFLLHVLRVQTAKDEVALDDKRLIDIFDKELKNSGEMQLKFVKEFIYNLLKCKFLFDKYVIKREFTANTDRWSLKSLKWYSVGKVKNGVKYTNTFGEEDSFDSDNRKVLMLLSMFHVSIPSMSYKYWLNASLNYLFHQFEIDSKDYISYLEHIAKSFVFDRYLARQPSEYFAMIYENLNPVKREIDKLDLNKLRYGRIENNLVFNFLDYVLWIHLKGTEKDSRVNSFEYTFRSSVEHYYPQTPINNDVDVIDESFLHSFGNLCLISHEKNSRLSNFSATYKRDFYSKSATLDSMKQFLMMKHNHWSIDEIETHNQAMIDLFSKNLNSDFKQNIEISVARKWFKEFQLKDKVLLVRALLCFGDVSKHINGEKFNLFDFNFIQEHETFQKFEHYVNEKSPKSLTDIINVFSNSVSLKKDWRYFFIKYPDVIQYCKEGNYVWNDEGAIIYLLESEKNTTYKAKELYTKILQDYFQHDTKVETYCDKEGLIIGIDFIEDKYVVTNSNKNNDFQLHISNRDGTAIDHCLNVYLNGNTKAVKFLDEFKWEKNSEGYFERFGNSKLITLGDNYEENLSNSIEAIIKLLKNGFNIKLAQI
jgi:hypothetical protein